MTETKKKERPTHASSPGVIILLPSTTNRGPSYIRLTNAALVIIANSSNVSPYHILNLASGVVPIASTDEADAEVVGA